jgi:hypothetical protein
MILSNAELYEVVEELRTALQNAGYQPWSDVLADAMSISTSSTEILEETRLQLRKLQATTSPDALGLGHQLKETLSYLDDVLRDYFR